jgi:hypothetical protein
MLPELRESLKHDFFVLSGPWENHLGDSSGWEPLVRKLAIDINPILETWWQTNASKHDTPPRISRLAIEVGGLKVYMTWIPEELDEQITDLINRVEQMSLSLCIECGEPGDLCIIALSGFDMKDEMLILCTNCEDDLICDVWDDDATYNIYLESDPEDEDDFNV